MARGGIIQGMLNLLPVMWPDYESAMLVQGTGFWRAPEVLEELLKQLCDGNGDAWTEEMGVYS